MQALRAPALFAGRYEILDALRAAPEIETLRARDATTGDPVVLRRVPTRAVPPGTRQRIEHDALGLRAARSPALVQLLDVGESGPFLYWVTPFLEGRTLASRLEEGTLSLSEAIAAGRQLFEALAQVHARGLLHRDLRPGAIFLGSPGAPLRLTDFGLARVSLLLSTAAEIPVSIARYLAPEQAGLFNQPVEERADLYSAGVLLYECVAGETPFPAASAAEVLRQHLSRRPATLRSQGLPVPRAFDEILQRLLQKDPRGRYQSAAGALADLEALAEALSRGDGQPAIVVGARDRRTSLLEPSFIGRAAELKALTGAIDQALTGRRALALVEAPSGSGKTQLLDEFAQRSAERGAWVLRGYGVGQQAQKPFQVLEGIAREVLAQARLDPALARQWRLRLQDVGGEICAVLPQLAPVLAADTQVAPGPEAHGEARSLHALALLLDAVGTAERPALFLLDDFQWTDDLTVRLIERWARGGSGREAATGRAPAHALLVVAFRSEEVPGTHALRALDLAAHVELRPLAKSDVRALLASMAGPLPETGVEAVIDLSGGNPFLAVAALQGLVEAGALVPCEQEGWEFQPRARAPSVAASGSIPTTGRAAVLGSRLEHLPSDCLRLLSAGAVLGKSFNASFAAELCGLAPLQALPALHEARRRHLVWADAQGTRWAFTHDQVRDALLARIWGGDRKRLHLRVAQRFLQRQQEEPEPARLFDIVYHCEAAGEFEAALPAALEAARTARASHSLDVAEHHYRVAERGAKEQPEDVRRGIAEGLGEVLLLRGHYEEAQRKIHEALRLAQTPLEEARLESKLGEIAFKRSDTRAASAALVRALARLGKTVPRGRLALTLQLLREILVQLLHVVFPAIFVARKPASSADGDRLAMRIFGQLAYLNFFTHGPASTLWAHLRELNLAETYTPTPELASAWSKHGPAMILFPLHARGLRYTRRSLALRREQRDPWGEGQSLSFVGTVSYSAVLLLESRTNLEGAIRLLERTGDRWEANNAGYMLSYTLHQLGELRASAANAERVYWAARDIGDEQAAGCALDMWSKSSAGRVDAALIARSRKLLQVDNALALTGVLQAEGYRLLCAGQAGAAAAVYAEALQVCEEHRLFQVVTSGIPLWLGRILREQAEALPAGPERTRLLRASRAANRRGLVLAWRFRLQLPFALRERALLAAHAGRLGRARRLLDRSLALAAAQGARLEEARTRVARGKLGQRAGWQDAADDEARGRGWLGRLGAEFS